MQEEVIFQRRNRLKKHFVNTSNVLLYGYQNLSDAAKITYQVVDGFDWENKETRDSKGYAFPAGKTLAGIRGMSERTIQRHIKELEIVGLLTRIRRRNKPSVLVIEEVSENEVRKYLSTYTSDSKRFGDDGGDGNSGNGGGLMTQISRNDKNGGSHNHSETTKMAVAYMKKENESKEDEINVNENFTSKGNGQIQPLRDILIQYDLHLPREAKNKPKKVSYTRNINKDQRDYLASEMAIKLNDQKSLGCFRVIAEKVPQQVIFEVLSSIKETAREGNIKRSRGALFVDIIQRYCESHGIELGFGTKLSSTAFTGA